jgi:splicing factor 3B subunit 4
MSAAIEQRNQEATCYIGNLDEKVQEEILWELMIQCGPVVNVHMPKDKVTGKHQGYGFVEFRGEEDAEYCMKVMNMVKLYGKAIKVNKASQDKKDSDIGANVFIGNLDPEIDEKALYDTFSAFGGILQTPKIMRDPETGASKGYGFVSYDTFEASDLAIESMNGQYLSNRVIIVQYAFKKDTQGERHGSQAERLLAASQPQRFKPNTYFSGGVGDTIVNMGSTATIAGLAFQHQQLQAQLQLTAYGAMSAYGMMAPQGVMPPMMGVAPPMPGGIDMSMYMQAPPPPPMSAAGYPQYQTAAAPQYPPQAYPGGGYPPVPGYPPGVYAPVNYMMPPPPPPTYQQ